MNDQKRFQEGKMSEDTRQIKAHEKSDMDKEQIRGQGKFKGSQ